MKALSLRPEWAWAVFIGEKDIEYRTWQTKYRGDLLICSSSRKLKGTIPGHALIVCTLDDITYNEKEKIYEWHLNNFREIIPFPVKGKLHLYDVDDSLIQYLPTNMSKSEADDCFLKYFVVVLIAISQMILF